MGLAAHLQCRPPASLAVEKRSDARATRGGSVVWALPGSPGPKGAPPERHGALQDGEHGRPKRHEKRSCDRPSPGVRVGVCGRKELDQQP
eukprot:CAMPEP_0179997618 /NCGR_PEP_ID=MMETSP0984-20121128/8234_1 /TAXON_ID=483367 /ORGANISM="non described non described, Strain CCMP 2436" /LENGTH=89 /DNA_ID=CAMNT_0021917227 /DNA_START=480 /DNA_END=749 /DNA_ORIENTATION=+